MKKYVDTELLIENARKSAPFITHALMVIIALTPSANVIEPPDNSIINEIKKALEFCIKAVYDTDCDKCAYHKKYPCVTNMHKDVFDLINRLQAENERLKNHIQEGIDLAKQIPKMIELAKAEAYKECIEKVKEYIDTYEHLACEECECVPISKDGLDNLLKEMVGEDK